MCGFSGFKNNQSNNLYDYNYILNQMTLLLEHRGNDHVGKWYDYNDNVGFSHNRLSILDLSENGQQPMYSNSKRYVIVFNGEIYNHLKLRELFPFNFVWKSNSDTETLIEAIEFFGLDKCLNLIEGMFAFSIWDKLKKTLILVRDRFGEKPLYYTFQNDNFIFSSEIKSIKSFPNLKFTINNNSLYSFLKCGFVNSNNTIYNEIQKIEPGSYLIFSNNSLKKINYYIIQNEINYSTKNPYNLSYNEAIRDLDTLLIKSIQQQLLSDVNIGVYLSGGVDSSLIASIYQIKLSSIPINTYTIAYGNTKFDERFQAKEISNFLNTNHTEIILNKNCIINSIENIQNSLDEPYADISMLPMVFLSKSASLNNKVVLSGDGADELFCGYNRYSLINNKIFKINKQIKSLISYALTLTNPFLFNFIKQIVYKFNKNVFYSKNYDKNLYKLIDLLKAKDLFEIYFIIISNSFKNDILKNNNSFSITDNLKIDNKFSYTQQLMIFDTLTYLPNNLLYKYDSSTMLNTIEGRAPFLDKNIFDFAWRLPERFKFNEFNNKVILRDILKSYLPNMLINKHKNGFSPPVSDWLRNELKDFTFDILNFKKINEQGLLNPSIIETKLKQHMSGNHNWQNELWNVLMFQIWFDKNK
jgi:asparagine synthase (glutamine-hydrolysing)